MNYLGLNCTVEEGFGRLMVIILTAESDVYNHIFRSPSVFSFNKNSAEILNWHRDNIISLIVQFNIDALVVKKTERTSFFSKPKDSDIFKLYLEGVMLSLAGSVGKLNKHFYKSDIQTALQTQGIFDKDIKTLLTAYALNNCMGFLRKPEIESTKDALLATLALRQLT